MSIKKNIENKDKKVTLIYNGHHIEDRLTFAELKRIMDYGFHLRGFDVSERNIPRNATERLIHQLKDKSPEEILDIGQLDKTPKNLNEIVRSVQENSTILKTPIVIRNGRVEQIDTSNDYIFEEIKSIYQNENSAEKQKGKSLLSTFGGIMVKHISVIFLLLALTFGLAHHIVEFHKLNQLEIKTENIESVVNHPIK